MVINYFICTIGIFTLFNVFTVSESEKLQCMGEDNKPVDWFIIYKLPKLEKVKRAAADANDDRGKKYLYMSSSTMRSPGWKYPAKLISDVDSIPGITLKPLYVEGKQDQVWILYNDQPPEGSKVKGAHGHTKGVVAANKEGGFWIVHSVPRFPEVPSAEGQYSYPDSGHNNGQTFLCMTLGSKEIEKVAKQLQFNQAGVYYSFYSQTLDSLYPTLVSVAKKTAYKLDEDFNIEEIKTSANNVFTSFAKSQLYAKDIYEELVAPTLKSSMDVETWRNGVGPLISNCTKTFAVKNVEEVQLCVKKECDSFPSTKDHSKWAASEDQTNPWICIGDINRAASQGKRGGGTVCMKNAKVWNAFHQAVESVEACNLPPKSPKEKVPKDTIPTAVLA
uniref:DNase TATD-2 n=1 Tax=Laodelphax striatellus TaxID=195883 RepID=A0A4D6FQU3_LAOST|nr:DNase TATD-2 [Laodelphax striatellus]